MTIQNRTEPRCNPFGYGDFAPTGGDILIEDAAGTDTITTSSLGTEFVVDAGRHVLLRGQFWTILGEPAPVQIASLADEPGKPAQAAIDTYGNLWVPQGDIVRRVTPDGQVTTRAGRGECRPLCGDQVCDPQARCFTIGEKPTCVCSPGSQGNGLSCHTLVPPRPSPKG
jgi:hypothetical protein